jgi:O-antigen/teichoic acid export membrane protein
MMAQSRTAATLWHYVFLSGRTVVSIITGVLIVPLYLHYLDLALYGAWLTTGNLLLWLTMVDPGVSDVLLQRIGKACGSHDHTETGLVVGSAAVLSGLIFGVVLLVGAGLAGYVVAFTNYHAPDAPQLETAFWLALPGAAMGLLANTPLNVVYGFQQTKAAGLAQNAIALLSIGLTVGLLVAGVGLPALAWGGLFTGFFKLMYSTIHAARLLRQHGIRLTYSRLHLRQFSRVFLYTFGSRLVETLTSNLDLIVVARFIGPQYVAMLELSRRPVRIVLSQVNFLTVAMLPTLPHLLGSGDAARLQRTTLTILQTVCWSAGLVAGGFILFNQPLVALWTGPTSFFGQTNNVLTCLGLFAASLAYSCANVVYTLGDIRFNALVSLARNLPYALLMPLLASWFGLTGLLVAFGLLTVGVDLLAFGRRVFRRVAFAPAQRRAVLAQVGLVGTLLGTCVALARYVPALSWAGLAGGAVCYGLAYVALLLGLSRSFRQGVGVVIRYRGLKPPGYQIGRPSGTLL